MRNVPAGLPVRPPKTMPIVAAASASAPAPASPAVSNTGANAIPVAGPPTRVTDPAITPSNGFSPKARAIPIPMKFWTKQKTVAKARKIAT
jgi:hypothetical protein